MVTRRKAREWAVMMLCGCDLNPPEDLDAALEAFWNQLEVLEKELRAEDGSREEKVFTASGRRNRESLDEMRAFTEERVRGVLGSRDALDSALEPFLDNWSMYRLGTVERNVLRLAAWEMSMADPPIPAAIAINEAVDVVKFFSEKTSGRFLNGVLDKFAKSRVSARPE